MAIRWNFRRAYLSLSVAAMTPACGSLERDDSSAQDDSTGLGDVDGDQGEDWSGDDGPRFDVGGSDGTGTDDGNGTDCGQTLLATVRDFKQEHPDFEAALGSDPGIVESMIGADDKPVYAGNPTTPTTSGQENFDQWYRDVDDVNLPIELSLELVADGSGGFVIDDSEFFPIDGQGFGNEGNSHNYHFTLEIHTTFVYEGGEVFEFRGDDDLFVFINGHLAMDLGGVHTPEADAVDLDVEANALGLEIGGRYDLDFFFAERHLVMSNFRIETTIGCFDPPV